MSVLMGFFVMGENFWLNEYFQVNVLAPQTALGPDYDWQSIRQDHFISQSSQIS